MKKLICATAALAIVTGSQVIAAQAEDNFNVAGAFSIGGLLGPPSTGAGVSGSYWFTNNIGISAFATAAYDDYAQYGVWADYLFNLDPWSKVKIRPFAGVGFSFVDGPSGRYSSPYYSYSWGYDVDGQGVAVHTGVLHQAFYISNHLFFSAAAVYRTFDVDINYSDNYHRYRWKYPHSSYNADWSNFVIELGIHYFF